MAVPTSTAIAIDAEDPHRVCVIEPTDKSKHGGRPTLIGGKVKLGLQTHVECLHAEFAEEAGGLGAYLENVSLFAIKTDAGSDVREVTLGRVTDNACPDELRQARVLASYGAPDHVYLGTVCGVPAPGHDVSGKVEAKRCYYFDVRRVIVAPTAAQSAFGAQMDLYLAVYRLHLAGRPVEIDDFADLTSLRARLPALIRQYG
jgi:hypothetical protein